MKTSLLRVICLLLALFLCLGLFAACGEEKNNPKKEKSSQSEEKENKENDEPVYTVGTDEQGDTPVAVVPRGETFLVQVKEGVTLATTQEILVPELQSDVPEFKEDLIIEVVDEDPYSIVANAQGRELVILTPGVNGTIDMNVAEKTTLKLFKECVVAKEGFVMKVTDAAGTEITDDAAEIANGMIFSIYEEGKEEALVTLTINVITEEVIQETLAYQE